MEKFRTKTGFCEVTEDQLKLYRSGPRGQLSQGMFGNTMIRAYLLYGLMILTTVLSAITRFQAHENLIGSLLVVFALVLLIFLFRTRHQTATSVLLKETITSVQYVKAKPGLTRAHFLVHFVHNNKTKKRLILLPGSL